MSHAQLITVRHIKVFARVFPVFLSLSLLAVPAVGGVPAGGLEGVWRFEKRIDTRPDGTAAHLAEPEFEGLLIYSGDGFMSVILMPKGRIWTTYDATIDELRTTVAEGAGYAGRYEIDEQEKTVTHIVSVSLDPAGEGERLVRHYSFEGPNLVLSGDWIYQDEPMRSRIFWRRVRSTDTSAGSFDPVDPGRRQTLPGHPLLPAPLVSRRTPDGGTIRTALLSSSRSPYLGFIGFALSIDGRVHYFKTTTENPLTHQPPLHEPPDIPFHQWIFGEEVVLYGGDIPTRIARENGDVYDVELTKLPTTASFFEPTVVHTGYERPGDQPHNPHPEAILDECRRLRDPFEHDVCLHYQGGIRNDERICAEIVDAERADKCTTWIANIRAGRINQ